MANDVFTAIVEKAQSIAETGEKLSALASSFGWIETIAGLGVAGLDRVGRLGEQPDVADVEHGRVVEVDVGVTELVELGAGKVLSGLTKRINGDLSAVSIGTPEGIEAFLKTV